MPNLFLSFFDFYPCDFVIFPPAQRSDVDSDNDIHPWALDFHPWESAEVNSDIDDNDMKGYMGSDMEVEDSDNGTGSDHLATDSGIGAGHKTTTGVQVKLRKNQKA